MPRQADTLQHDVVIYFVDVLSLLLVVSYTQHIDLCLLAAKL